MKSESQLLCGLTQSVNVDCKSLTLTKSSYSKRNHNAALNLTLTRTGGRTNGLLVGLMGVWINGQFLNHWPGKTHRLKKPGADCCSHTT